MQFDMSKAWNDAVAMLGANREVILAIAGVFFFLPTLVSTMMIPEIVPPAVTDEAALREYFVQLYAANAPVIAVSTLVQLVGTLTLLALLRDDSKPTVGEALKTGLVGMLPYIGVYLLLVVAAFLVALVAVGIPSALGVPVLAAVLLVLLIPAACYVGVKLSLVTPAIAIEKMMNPIAIIRRSWTLTKGNSLRLFGFYLLLGVVYIVVSILAGVILGVIVALLGQGTASEIGQGIVTGIIGGIGTAVFTAVIAAVHRQLAGPSTGSIDRTFG